MRTFVTLLLLAALAPAVASAGTFHVYGLGLNGAGCPSGFQAQTFSPDKLRQQDSCSRWDVWSNRDGTPLRQGDFAGASMFAGEGTRFTGFSISSSGYARNGVIWTMAMCQTPFANCQNGFPRQGDLSDYEMALGSAYPGGRPQDATHLYAGVACTQATCSDSADAGRAVDVAQTESHVIVEDYSPPGAPSISGIATGWNSGERELAYTASDAGSGVASVTLTVDGSLHRAVNHSCLRVPAGGYSHPVPCAGAADGQFAVNEPGQLADGRHSLAVTTRDASGELASASQEFLVDNNNPAHPVGLSVTGGEGWRGANDFALTWENPDQGSGSGIDGIYYKIGSPPTSGSDGDFAAGSGIASLEHVQVPGDGDWPLYAWLRDEAGNAHPSNAAEVHLRLDSTAPVLAFADRDPDNPAEVRVATSDDHSATAGGQIEIRRRGAAEWHALETWREGTELVSAVPDDQLERGTYELQATAWDGAGNRATTTRRAGGREMVLDLPLRGDTRLGASLVPRTGKAGRAARAVRVGYRRAVLLRGVLRAATGRLPDARLGVYTRPLAGGDWRPLAEVVTDASGRYAVRLPDGGSRELRVRFPGDRRLRPSERTARLVVRGWASLRLRPKRLRRGGTIAFAGRVGRLGAALPAGGKLIQIQYLDGRRWRPAVKLGHTDGRGRFAIRYRFRRISRPTRIYFRILVPAEGGWPYATGWSRIRVARVRP